MRTALRALLLFSILTVLPRSASAIGYPALDTSSHWSLQKWGFTPSAGFYLQGAGKYVWTAPGQRENRTVFYNASVVGIRLNGRDYPFNKPDYLGEMEAVSYLVRYASFNVMAGLIITVVYYLHDNGEFETYAYFQGSAFNPAADWELVQRFDYDLLNAGDNIAEFLWSPTSEGGTISPPQYPRSEAVDARLVYAPNPSGPSYWAASGHEVTVYYPPLGKSEGEGAENPGFARILSAGQPQFGMVLWGDPATSLNASFRAYAYFDGNLGSVGDPTVSLQLTGEDPSRPRYAYSGRDQMIFVRTKVPVEGMVRFHSKVFQRPSTNRPITVRVFQHPAQDLGGWVFDPDYSVREGNDGPRTFRRALEDLAGSADVNVLTARTGLPYLPYNGFAGPGQGIRDAQLHSLMSWARSSAPAPTTGIRDFLVDIFLVNWTLMGESDAWESSFDKGNADLNRVSREGAAVFWPNIRGNDAQYGRSQSVLSALHGLGLSLNMHPAWSNCPFSGYCWSDGGACGGVRCGQACPTGASNCRYRAHTCENECTEGTIMSNTDVSRNLLRFNASPALGSRFSEIDWYRYAPEAWLKPGRFGIGQVTGPQLPGFLVR